MHHYRGELWLILVTLLAASGWFVSKAALQELPAAGFIGARMVGAALLFLPCPSFANGQQDNLPARRR